MIQAGHLTLTRKARHCTCNASRMMPQQNHTHNDWLTDRITWTWAESEWQMCSKAPAVLRMEEIWHSHYHALSRNHSSQTPTHTSHLTHLWTLVELALLLTLCFHHCQGNSSAERVVQGAGLFYYHSSANDHTHTNTTVPSGKSTTYCDTGSCKVQGNMVHQRHLIADKELEGRKERERGRCMYMY